MTEADGRHDPLHELLCEALEASLAAVEVYQAARPCIRQHELFREWESAVRRHEDRSRILRGALEELGLDPEEEMPGRLSIRHIGQSLIEAIQIALASGDEDAAQRIAVGCIALVHASDRLHWDLIGQFAMKAEGRRARVLGATWDQADEDIESDRDHALERLRRLWLEFLDLSPALALVPESGDGQGGRKVLAAPRGRGARGTLRLIVEGEGEGLDEDSSCFAAEETSGPRKTPPGR